MEALCGAGPTSVEGLELRAGQSVGLTGGQEVLLGKRRTLFLTSAELHLLLTLANESMTRLVLPPAGVLLSALQRLVTSPNAPGPSSPPFLLEVPTEGQESPSSFATVAVPPEEMEHALRAGNDRARIYSIVGRDPTLSEVLLGRHDDCDVVLTDASVSKHHARVCRVEDGWELVDLGSQNGTSVRGERVLAHLRVPIHPGDQVHLGSYRCVFLEPEGVRKLLAFLTSRLPH